MRSLYGNALGEFVDLSRFSSPEPFPEVDLHESAKSLTIPIRFIFLFVRHDSFMEFEGVVAEIPGPFAHGETLQEVRQALAHQLLHLLATNCQLMLANMGENAITETVTLTITPDALQGT